MSYKVEVTADSLTELGGKLLALAAQFQTVSAEDTRVPPSPRKKAAPKQEVISEPKHEPEVVGDQPDEPKAEEPKAEEPKAEEPKAEEPQIDFNLEVTPLVLRATKELGRERMLAIYEQFGIARASELDPKLLPELIGIIKDGLGE